MNNSYYLDGAGEVQGPVSPEDLKSLHRSGQVSATTQVCEEGTEDWMPYFEAAEPSKKVSSPVAQQQNRETAEPSKKASSPVAQQKNRETAEPSKKASSPVAQQKNRENYSAPISTKPTSIESKEEHYGITKSQGTILIIILLIGIGAPFWVFLKPTPKWQYQTIKVLAETSGAASTLGANYEKLAYKTIPDFSSRLDSLGSRGWELVGVFLEHETSHPNFGKEDYVSGLQPNTRPQRLVCILKRQEK